MKLFDSRLPSSVENKMTGQGEALVTLAAAFIRAGRGPIEAARDAHICLDELCSTDADTARKDAAEASEGEAENEP